jgi:uncharacterized protein with NAD-binding domain and iron-sulfur cluster
VANGKTKIAVLGGGVGALTAAFELTEHDQDNRLYDITVYTLGWRLGGKCAVGRNEDQQWRAEEHGLHIWAGFYDNAFDLVRRCYAGLGCPNSAWRSHFEGLNHFTIMERSGHNWEPWLLQVSPNDLVPGSGYQQVTPLSCVKVFAAWVWQHYATSGLRDHLAHEHLEAARQRLALAEMLPLDAQQIDAVQKTTMVDQIKLCLEELRTIERNALSTDSDLRHSAFLVELGLAIIHGILDNDVFFYGFDHIDDVEWCEWLVRNGCAEDIALNSAPVRACYDYVFGYLNGNRRVGAGTGTRALLRFLLNYKGSILYTLQTPMGDFLFASLYELLHKRHVRFEFFHRVDKLCLTEDGNAVSRIELCRQVTLKHPEREYCPLVKLPGGQWSWPANPLKDQIVEGEKLTGYDLESYWTDWNAELPPRILELKTDFDVVILGIGLGALEPICADLTKQHRKWAELLNEVKTTQTMGVQLWLKSSTQELGWPDPRTVLTAFADPLNTWGDNSQLISTETWPDKSAPGSLHYFVGIFPEEPGQLPPRPNPAFPEDEKKRAKDMVRGWIETKLPILWPRAYDRTTRFRWDLLDDPSGQNGAARLDSQYIRPNINPSDRYVLSVPGSVRFRLTAEGSGVGNLYLAGDWVRTGLNAGCVEAAVMAGRAAARAITGADMPISGENELTGSVPPISLLPIVNVLQNLKRAAAGGVGHIDAYCAILRKPTSYVKTKLPPGLTLVPPTRPEGEHPVILLFSRQRHVRPGFMPFGGLNYHEFVELIPYVTFNDLKLPSGGPFNYMPYLLLDQIAPVIVGTNLYGFNKRLARIGSKGGSYEIRHEFGEVRALFHDEWLPGDISKFSHLKKVRELMERPLIGRTQTGSWAFSYLDFRLDAATFQAINGHVAIGEPLMAPGSGPEGTYRFHSILDRPYGAFRFSTNWTLSVPLWHDDTLGAAVPKDLKDFTATWSNAVLGRFKSQF